MSIAHRPPWLARRELSLDRLPARPARIPSTRPLRAPRQVDLRGTFVPRRRRGAAGAATAIGVHGKPLELELTTGNWELNERILSECVPAPSVEVGHEAIDTSALDALLVPQGVPQAAARSGRLARHASGNVRRPVDVHRRKLPIGDARLVDEWHGFGGTVETHQSLRLQHVHLRPT